MKKIVLINQSAGYLTEDVANAALDSFDDVTLICGNTPSLRLNQKIKVLRIPEYDKSSIRKRIASWLGAYKGTVRLLRQFDKDTHVMYFSNPPISYFAAGKVPNPYSIVVFDIWPDALDNIKCPAVIKRLWAKKNRKYFAGATKIVTLSEGMKEALAKYVSLDKVEAVDLWPRENDVELVASSDNKFIKEHGLEGKFIVMYSGNMGFTHNLEVLVEVAKSMKDNPDVRFIFIGEGGKKAMIEQEIRENGMDNCLVLPYLPVDEIKYSLSSADLGVVTLTSQTASASVPSKTFNLLSYGLPLLCIAPEESELAKLISAYGCGRNFKPENTTSIRDYILRCMEDRDYQKQLSDNSAKASRNFTVANAAKYL